MKLFKGLISFLFFVNSLCMADTAYRQLEPGKAEFKTEKAIIHVSLSSSIYTYELTNLQESPVTGFKVTQHHSYAFTPPPGWQRKMDRDFFYADTNQFDKAIQKGQTSKFTLRVSSRGATLGTSDIEIYCKSGEKIIIAGVWSPASEPPSYPLIVAGTIAGLMLFHIAMIYRKKKRTSEIVTEH